MNYPQEFNDFLKTWEKDPVNAKKALQDYMTFLKSLPGLDSIFVSRPGISHSLRVLAENSKKIVALVDIIDDEPDNRWLSVCFFAAMITDPEELGDYVPQGLESQDAICFNLDEDNPDLAGYIKKRLGEAAGKAHA